MLLHTDPELRAPLHSLVEARRVTTHFQPIFSVRRKSVVGLEALSRGIGPRGDLIAPYTLFKQAAAEGIAGAVEDLCRESAVRNFHRLRTRPEELLLFLNLDLTGMTKPSALSAELEALIRAPGLDPRNVGVEFLESRLDDVGRFGELARRCASAASWSSSTTWAPGTPTSIAFRCSAPTSSRSIGASSPASTATSTSRRPSRAWSVSPAGSARWWSPRGSRPRPRR